VARREISAGCVVFQDTADGTIVVLTRPRGKKAWALPKGNLQPGERTEEAARREANEETGYTGELRGRIDTIKYTYMAKWEDPPARIFKIVTFFLMQHTGGDSDNHDAEVDEVEWFPIEDAIRNASYPTERDILKKARDMIGNARSKS
jgi:8-oxo-dGTP pyrophosphatase MutT (NUDIX family)